MKYRNIQVFLTGDTSAEINADLIDMVYAKGLVQIDWKEGSFKSRTVIPYTQIRMIRITK